MNSACWEASVLQLNPLLNWTSRNEESKGYLGVSNRLAMEYILVSHFDGDDFFKLSELHNWTVHDLHLPVRVLATVYTNSRSPSLLANNYYNEGVHLVE